MKRIHDLFHFYSTLDSNEQTHTHTHIYMYPRLHKLTVTSCCTPKSTILAWHIFL